MPGADMPGAPPVGGQFIEMKLGHASNLPMLGGGPIPGAVPAAPGKAPKFGGRPKGGSEERLDVNKKCGAMKARPMEGNLRP